MLKSINILLGILILSIGEIIFAKLVLKEDIKVSKPIFFLVLIIVTLISTITKLHLTGVAKTLAMVIIHIIEFKYLFKIDYSKSIFLTIIYIALLIIPEAIGMFTIRIVLNIDKNYFYNEIASGITANCIICIFLIGITLPMQNKLNKLINYNLENNKKLIVFSILSFICITIVFYNAFSNIVLNLNLIASIFTMAIFVIILISLVRQMLENNNLTKKYEQTLEFMATYEDEVEKQRVLRHETKNAFLSIKAQLTDKSKEIEIIEYINSILKEDTKMKYEEYAKFKYMPANGIKGLCYYKVQEAENKGLKVSLNISPRIEKSHLSKLTVNEVKELAKILGVFLDNAIEASVNSAEKTLGFEAYIINNDVKLIISNSYQGKIEINKIGKERYSTKGKKRGHGLLLVKSIINNNNIFETSTEITDKLYIQNIIIKKPTLNK